MRPSTYNLKLQDQAALTKQDPHCIKAILGDNRNMYDGISNTAILT